MWLNSMLITQVEEKKNSFRPFAFNSVKAFKYTVMSETGGSEPLMDDDPDMFSLSTINSTKKMMISDKQGLSMWYCVC